MSQPIHVETNILPTARLLIVFCGMAYALLVSFIDQNAITVSLPILGEDLHASATISWAGTSALIANTVFQVLYGRISDILGRKPLFILCIGLLTLGDLLCGFAKTGPQLFVFRGIAGVGNGGIAALAMIIVSDVVTLEKRGKYQGILGACVGLGNVIGPFMAAAVTEHWRWQGIFWIVSILSFTSGIIVLLVVPPSRVSGGSTKEKLQAIDWTGLISSSAGLILLLIPITSVGSNIQWNSPPIISMLTVGSVLMVVFIVVEWRFAAMPLLPLKFFRMPQVSAILIQNLLMGVVYYSNLYFLPMYFQNARRWPIMKAAILIMPLVASQSVFSVASGQYISHFKRYGEVIWCGYGLWALGSGLTLLFGTSTPPWKIVLVLLIEGAGVGFVFQPTLVAIQAATAKEDRAVITSVRNFTRSLGGAVGIAVSTVMLSHVVSGGLSSLPSSIKKEIMKSVLTKFDLEDLTAEQRKIVLTAYAKGYRSIFIMWMVLQIACFILCFAIKDRGLKRPEETNDKQSRNGLSSENQTETEAGNSTDGSIEPKVTTSHQLFSSETKG